LVVCAINAGLDDHQVVDTVALCSNLDLRQRMVPGSVVSATCRCGSAEDMDVAIPSANGLATQRLNHA